VLGRARRRTGDSAGPQAALRATFSPTERRGSPGGAVDDASRSAADADELSFDESNADDEDAREGAPPTSSPFSVERREGVERGTLFSPAPSPSRAAKARPNGSEFCCRTGPLTNHRRYRTNRSASADSSNSMLECAPASQH
jgi:hypothetical protein